MSGRTKLEIKLLAVRGKKVIVEDLFLMATSCEGPSGARVDSQD
jgi:hypothetical protein